MAEGMTKGIQPDATKGSSPIVVASDQVPVMRPDLDVCEDVATGTGYGPARTLVLLDQRRRFAASRGRAPWRAPWPDRLCCALDGNACHLATVLSLGIVHRSVAQAMLRHVRTGAATETAGNTSREPPHSPRRQRQSPAVERQAGIRPLSTPHSPRASRRGCPRAAPPAISSSS